MMDRRVFFPCFHYCIHVFTSNVFAFGKCTQNDAHKGKGVENTYKLVEDSTKTYSEPKCCR